MSREKGWAADSWMAGIPIVMSPHLRDGLDVITNVDGRQVILIGTTEPWRLDARNEARAIVRDGMADVLDWLGIQIRDERHGADFAERIREWTTR